VQADYLAGTFGLAGRTALVTGSSGGLGFAIAEALGRAGARIVINGRDPGRCDDAAGRLAHLGMEAITSSFDVTNDEAASDAATALRARGIRVDVLVANAGVQNRKPFLEISLAEWRALLGVHVDGAFNCLRAFIPSMLEQGFGRIVLMSSIAGQAAIPHIAPYATAKGAIGAFARAMAVEYGGRGITVNAVAPGFLRTSLTQGLQASPEFQRFISTAVPAGRWGELEEIAPAVLFLASPAAAFVNGHVLTIDGGLLARM